MLLQFVQYLQPILRDSMVFYGAIPLTLLLGLALAVVTRSGNTYTTNRELRHLQRLGLTTSNMADQFDPKFSAPNGTPIDGPARIKAIYLHPIKSCGPVEVNSALLTKTGFMHDRCFAFATELVKGDTVEASKGKFISQRTKPNMSLIKTELWLPHKGSNPYDQLVRAGGCVVLSFPDPDISRWSNRLETIFHSWKPFAAPQISFIAPLQVTAAQIDEFQVKMKTFSIHHRDATGLDMGKIPSVAIALPKLKKFLKIPEGQNLTLLKCTPDTLARTDRNLAPLKHIGSPAVHGYTDQQPININSLSSVHAVSRLLPPENQPLNALRFRANIWITNVPEFAEETWKRCRILSKSASMGPRASVSPSLSVVCRTSRCTIPNVNPDTGTFDADTPLPQKKRGRPQPSTTLVEYRTVETGNKMALGYIGVHCVPEDESLGKAEEQKAALYVAVGDEIEVLERGVHLYGSTGNDY
ncbi:Molybdenum cofactor sulfurase, C-terminal [Penicillium camemberti]|uniref:Molybdenum cofactor sulfurase, C-terminal n=1 Tax=Penicillium camemberti (strain FM 013) TaxID=1429867 RepID=A0A0G4PIH9_PENC3|nr:Molybdenum cofactor sulfurase, C-terminal [Penicillium camemberti]